MRIRHFVAMLALATAAIATTACATTSGTAENSEPRAERTERERPRVPSGFY